MSYDKDEMNHQHLNVGHQRITCKHKGQLCICKKVIPHTKILKQNSKQINTYPPTYTMPLEPICGIHLLNSHWRRFGRLNIKIVATPTAHQ